MRKQDDSNCTLFPPFDGAPILKELVTRYQNEVANKLLEEEEI